LKPSATVIVSQACEVTCFEQEKVAAIKAELAEEEHLLPQLAELYKLLGNTTRLKILLALAQRELCVCDVSHVLGLSVAATSHQLKLLRDRGWLRMRNDGKMVYYRLHSESLLKALKGDLCLLQAAGTTDGRLKRVDCT
jgi:DNA-binding transcriptional ArsR family regulator